MTTGDHWQKVRDQNQVRTHAGVTGIRTRVGHKVGEDKTQRPHRTAHRLARQGKLGGCVGQRKAGEAGSSTYNSNLGSKNTACFSCLLGGGIKVDPDKGEGAGTWEHLEK